MTDHVVVSGETWDSMAEAFAVPVSWLLLSNGHDPSDPPDPPVVGSTIQIPPDPPDHAVSPGNDHSLDVGDGGLDEIRIRLHDASGVPMTNVRYSIHHDAVDKRGVSADGWISVIVPSGLCEVIQVQWGPQNDSSNGFDSSSSSASPSPSSSASSGSPPSSSPPPPSSGSSDNSSDSEYAYQLSVMTGCSQDTDSDWMAARLNNLGYDPNQGLDIAVRSFQSDYGINEAGLTDDGTLPPHTASTLSQIFDGDCDATPSGGAPASGAASTGSASPPSSASPASNAPPSGS